MLAPLQSTVMLTIGTARVYIRSPPGSNKMLIIVKNDLSFMFRGQQRSAHLIIQTQTILMSATKSQEKCAIFAVSSILNFALGILEFVSQSLIGT